MISGVIKPLRITDYTLTSALGVGRKAHWQRLRDGRSGLTPCEFFQIDDLTTYVGQVAFLDGVTLDEQWAAYDCRNNRLAQLTLEQDGFIDAVRDVAGRYGAKRVGLFMGTSTSGIHQTEQAYLSIDPESEPLPQWYHYSTTHNTYAVADFVRRYLGLEGLSVTVSTACSSSTHAIGQAFWAVRQGMAELAITGGSEAVFSMGFLKAWEAMRVVSPDTCRPFSKDRRGLILGEGGAMLVLEPLDAARARGARILAEVTGFGMSSDAYHLTQPTVEGPAAAMQAALDDAGLQPEQIGYINAHGTGTLANDVTETAAIHRVFPGHARRLPVSSTKSMHGHALGAAGALEAIASILTLRDGFLPPTVNYSEPDPACDLDVVPNQGRPQRVDCVMSNSFAFGGLNAVLIFQALPAAP